MLSVRHPSRYSAIVFPEGTYADKQIAHSDRKKPKTVPKFNDVDASIDEIIRIVCRYKLLFEAVCVDDPTPTIQYDWKAIFRDPWLTDPGA